jgi:hypothetical protein
MGNSTSSRADLLVNISSETAHILCMMRVFLWQPESKSERFSLIQRQLDHRIYTQRSTAGEAQDDVWILLFCDLLDLVREWIDSLPQLRTATKDDDKGSDDGPHKSQILETLMYMEPCWIDGCLQTSRDKLVALDIARQIYILANHVLIHAYCQGSNCSSGRDLAFQLHMTEDLLESVSAKINTVWKDLDEAEQIAIDNLREEFIDKDPKTFLHRLTVATPANDNGLMERASAAPSSSSTHHHSFKTQRERKRSTGRASYASVVARHRHAPEERERPTMTTTTAATATRTRKHTRLQETSASDTTEE